MKNLILLSFILFFLGCQKASNYLHKTIMPESQFIKNVESGLSDFHQADYKKSTEYFQTAIDIYRLDEDKPLISFSDMTIFDYHGEGYDKVFLHNYNALNYLMLGNLEDAKVETRNANFIQKKAREEFYKEIENFNINYKNQYSYIINQYEKLFNSVNTKHTPYQNPFAYYISALLYEEENKYDDALIDIRHALKYQSGTAILKDKLRFYQTADKRKKSMELFFDIGRSPLKLQTKIPVRTNENTKNMIYLPAFKIYDSEVSKIILVDSHNHILKVSTTLSDIDAIKINEFKVKLPYLINQVFKESAKEVLAGVASQKSSIAEGFVKTIYTIYSQYNLYTWRNLPKKIDVISFIPKKNESYRLKVVGKNGKILDTRKLTFNCAKKYKNCYQYYRILDSKFY